MKITRIEPILVDLPYDQGAPKVQTHAMGKWDTQPILFVKVETDEGITGWGEAFSHASTPVTITAISQVIAKLAVGKDPLDRQALLGPIIRRTQSMGRAGPVQFALSGLEIALWDIAGKAAGQPVWKLLGGDGRKKSVPAYASLFRLDDPAVVAKVSAKAVERGYSQVKLHEHTIAATAAARAAIGPNVPLMVDTNCFWDKADDVVAICKELEPYDLAWLEEPYYPIDSYDVLAKIRAAVNVPLAAGENLGNYNDGRWLADAGGVDVVQPSVCKIGGIEAVRKVIAYAESKGLRGVPHSPLLGPSLVAAIHIIAAMPNELACEHRYCDLEASPLGDAVVAKNGRLAVPDAPGLGFEVDLKVIEKYRVG